MDSRLENRLLDPLHEREEKGLDRQVRMYVDSDEVVDLSNNDYLDLARHTDVVSAAKEALDKYGSSSSASPLITGFGPAHQELLDELKQWHGFACGMIWNSGYTANQAILSNLPRKGDLVLADRLIHNSMVSGILRSRARFIRYPHCSLVDLEMQLGRYAKEERIVFVVTESVFSMHGDFPDLSAMAELKRRYPFFWIVDEAHAIGWYGELGSGLVEESRVTESVDLLVGTLGKGLGSMGAYTLFHSETLKRYFENFAGEFIYSTYLSPSAAAAATASVRLAREMKSERDAVHSYSRELRHRLRAIGLDVPDGDGPILPVQIGSNDRVMAAAASLEAAGIRVGAIRPPTVPEGEGRLRISLRTGLSQDFQDTIVAVLRPFAEGEGSQ